MDDLGLLVDLHRDGDRQGPGSDDTTRLAIALSGLADNRDLAIADLGCGTGASTLVLAETLDARVHSVDLFPAFLDRLDDRARRRGLAEHITTTAGSMDDLPYGDSTLDVIWSEGAIYNIGFGHGVRAWQRFLKPGGLLAVSELTWLTHERPAEIHDRWTHQYAEVATASAKLAVVAAERSEVDLFERYSSFFGYGFYLARRAR